MDKLQQKIIEANLEDLVEILSKLSPTDSYYFYAQALRDYLSGNLQALYNAHKENRSNPEGVAVALRYELRARALQASTIEAGIQYFQSCSDLLWKGELAFLIARSFEICEDHKQGSKWYKISAKELEAAGAKKKSIKAFQNYLAEENRAHPDRRLIPEFLYIFKKASKIGEKGVAGVALMNISREYERVGAYRPALKFVNRALSFLERDAGSLHYYLALVQRSHLFYSMGREEEAFADYEAAFVSDHSEVKAALSVIENLFQGKGEVVKKDLTPGWKYRLQDQAREKNKLGDMESKFISYIAETPRDKFQIIEYLFGTTMEFEKMENRFKNLLGRVRKKHPNLLVFENGKYRISDISLLPEAQRRKAG